LGRKPDISVQVQDPAVAREMTETTVDSIAFPHPQQTQLGADDAMNVIKFAKLLRLLVFLTRDYDEFIE
jgi:hypothetical protein